MKTEAMLSYDEKRRKVNHFAVSSIKMLSALTVVILVVIIGYLVVRGLYKQERTQTQVLPHTVSRKLGLAQPEIPFSLVANKEAKIKTLDWNTLREMARGRVVSLRRISAVNENFFLYIDESVADDFARYLQMSPQDLISGGAIIGSSAQIIQGAGAQNGAVAILPVDKGAVKVPSRLKDVVYEEYVLAAHPSVTQLYGNHKVGVLTDSQLDSLLAGSFSNWQELHGGDVPLTVLPNAFSAASVQALSTRNGAVALSTQKDVYEATQMGNPVEVLEVYRVVRGPNLTYDYLVEPTQESGRFGGIGSIIINTLSMIVLTTVIAAPLGIGAAVYLVEYAKKGRLTAIIRSGIDVLASIPSIIFGLFGLLVFVQLMGWSFSLISGTLTVALMILPTIIRTSEEAIRSVDQRLREASMGMGATKMETIWRVVLPSALNGITTGIILAMGRALGETAALLYTIGSSTAIATGLFSGSRVLALHIMLTINEGQSFDKAFASAFVLIVMVLAINTFARWMMSKASVENKGK